MDIPYAVKNEVNKPANCETRAKAELLGPVKHVMQTTYRVYMKAGQMQQGKVDSETYHSDKNYIVTYNQAGLKMRDLRLSSDGQSLHTFNDDGKSDDYISNHGDEKRETRHKHFYDEKGNHIKTIATNHIGERLYHVLQTFNEHNNMVEHLHLGETDDRLISKVIHFFDDAQRHIGVQHFNSKGEMDYYSTRTYNEQGLETSSAMVYTDKESKKNGNSQTREYNEKGDCIRTTFYDGLGNVKNTYTYTHEYDSDGKRIPPPPPVDEDLEKITYETTLDEKGNWIKKIILYEEHPLSIIHREIVYFGEDEDRPLTHILTTAENKKDMTKKDRPSDEVSPEMAKWIAEEPGKAFDNFPITRHYVHRFQEFPSINTYTGPYIEAMALLNEMKQDFDAEEIHFQYSTWDGWKKPQRYIVQFPEHPGYMMHAIGLSQQDKEEFLPNSLASTLHDDNYYISQFQFLMPSPTSQMCNEYFEDQISEMIDNCSLKKKPDKPRINIIEVDNKGFNMKEYPVDNSFIIRDLDVNYGHGFTKFHTDLMARFNSSTKGLVLFHGEPGTGKTYYIRHLLRSMVSSKKVVIYMPPNMVDHLVEPSFMTFLMEEVQQWSEEGNFCVMLIEDAEPLLAKRQEGVRIQGITNLLNMTDGLLNDMLNLQIICTFNVDVRKLDSALLRPGRLIARKEFRPLPELDANLLAQRLGIKHHFNAPATLGEIYAMRKDSHTLLHDVNAKRDGSERIDDLV